MACASAVYSGRVRALLAPAAQRALQLQQQTQEPLERQMIPPDGLAPGFPLLFPDASSCPAFGSTHLSTSSAQLRLRPTGLQGATPSPPPKPADLNSSRDTHTHTLAHSLTHSLPKYSSSRPHPLLSVAEARTWVGSWGKYWSVV